MTDKQYEGLRDRVDKVKDEVEEINKARGYSDSDMKRLIEAVENLNSRMYEEWKKHEEKLVEAFDIFTSAALRTADLKKVEVDQLKAIRKSLERIEKRYTRGG